MCNLLYDSLSRCIGTGCETVIHVLDHDVQDVDIHVEFSRDVTSDVSYDTVTRDVTCLHDVFCNVFVHLMNLDVSSMRLVALTSFEVMYLTLFS